MEVFLQRRSSWVDSASFKSFTARSGEVNLQSGDGQTIHLPVSLFVSASPFLLSLLLPTCPCYSNTTTISLPSTRGFILKLLAQIFSGGETEKLPGEIIKSCLLELQEVLELLETGIILKVSYTRAPESLKVSTVESFTVREATVAIKEEFEISDSASHLMGVLDDWEVSPQSSKDCDSTPVDLRSFSGSDFKEASMDLKVKLKRKCATRKNYRDWINGDSKLRNKEDRCIKCSFCDRNFKKLKSLKNHVVERHGKKGLGEENHHCLKCDLNYSSIRHLERHIRLKHGEQMQEHIKEGGEFLRCPYCRIRFFNNSSMMKHISRKHEDDCEGLKDLKFKCSECNETFRRKDTLAIHIKRVHEGLIYACGVCDNIKLYKTDILKHCNASSHSKGLIYKIRDSQGDETDGRISKK
eukprot:GFUD01021769.1.p1 GENE.GFUD01021769.1~~GFUD01021769.1.p1  ORF type:complete len:412 (-),score=51.02 GFUD01021769.1:95-1330(-)